MANLLSLQQGGLTNPQSVFGSTSGSTAPVLNPVTNTNNLASVIKAAFPGPTVAEAQPTSGVQGTTPQTLPSNYQPMPLNPATLAGVIAQAIPRAALTTGLTVTTPGEQIDPNQFGPLASLILGSQPIESLQTSAAKYAVENPNVPLPVIAFGAASLNVLDMTPFGGEARAITAIRRVDNLADAMKIARDLKVTPDLWETAGAAFIKAKNEAEARAALESIANLQRTTRTAQLPRGRTGASQIGQGTPSPTSLPPSSFPKSLLSSPSNTTDLGKTLPLWQKFITSGEKILQKSGPDGVKMAQLLDRQRVDQDLLTGSYNLSIKNALAGLTKAERFAVTDALEGAAALNAKVAEATTKLRALLDDIATKAQMGGFEVRTPGGGSAPFRPRENYFPRQYDLDALAKGKKREEAINHLMETGQAKNPAEAESLLDLLIKNSERRAGNLENPRLVDLPGYERDAEKALLRYASSVARRFSEAKFFGKKDEVIDELIKGIANQRGDYKEAMRIFDFMVNGLPKNKLVSAIAQFNIATKLSLSAILNATQSINTMTKFGVLNTVRGIIRGFTKQGKELAELVNVYDDFILVKETGVNPAKLVRGVMYIFKKVENFNRRTAANAVTYKVPQLINTLRKDMNSGYAIRQLESLGVDLEKVLTGKFTDEDLLAAANKGVQKTQFKVEAFDLPPSWKTPLGRLLTQFKSFTFMQTKFVRDEVLKEARNWNLVPLVTFVTLAIPASYVVSMVRNALTGREQDNIDIRDWDKWMKAFGTIPTDLAIQGNFLYDTFQSDLKTPIEKGARVAGTFFGPTADEAGKLIGGLENIPRQKEKNLYLRKTGKEQDPYLSLERQAVEKIPFVGQYLKNTYLGYPKSTKTPEEKEVTSTMYGVIKELLKKDYNDPEVQKSLIEYMKLLPSNEERQKQLYVMSQNGIKTTGVSSSKEILDFRPTYDEIQRLKESDTPKAQEIVNSLTKEQWETYKKIRSAERSKHTSTVREYLAENPKEAVAYLRSLPKDEGLRIIKLLTPEEYKLYSTGK